MVDEKEIKEATYQKSWFAKLEKPGFGTFFVGPYFDETAPMDEYDAALAGESSVLADASEPEILVRFKAREAGMKDGVRSTNLISHMPISIEELEEMKKPKKKSVGFVEQEEEETRKPRADKTNGKQHKATPVSSTPLKGTMTPQEDNLAKEVIIVTRNTDIVLWLNKHENISGKIVAWVNDPRELEGRTVIMQIGLRYQVTELAHAVGILDIPDATQEQRKRDMTLKELEQAHTKLIWYDPPRRKDKSEI